MRKVSVFRMCGLTMIAGLLMAASCVNSSQKAKNSEDQTEQQQPVTEIEQAQQVQVQRAAFIPTESTPDFVDAAERSVDAVVHIMTKVVRQSNTYEDFFAWPNLWLSWPITQQYHGGLWFWRCTDP